MFEKVVNNFGKSDGGITSEKILISTRCIRGFLSNSIKKIMEGI